ncbi:hypothetical protein ACFL1H_06620 [Nanoarchaeota archaeon]
MMKMTKSLVVGRYQIFHKTHFDVVKYLVETMEHEVIIGLGSAQYNYLNPKESDLRVKHCLSLKERIEIVCGSLIDYKDRIKIVPLYDFPADEEWRDHINEKIGDFDYFLTEKDEEYDLFKNKCQRLVWPGRSFIRNGIVIDLLLQGKEYKQFLPNYCFNYLKKINIYDRLSMLHKIDAQNHENYLLYCDDRVVQIKNEIELQPSIMSISTSDN